jgi:oligoribonuclease (3'-5' exoribonuclease)
VIWLDDQMVGYGVENEQLSEITAITLDRELLREGATISLSYGEDKQGRVKLPEKLKLSGAR